MFFIKFPFHSTNSYKIYTKWPDTIHFFVSLISEGIQVSLYAHYLRYFFTIGESGSNLSTHYNILAKHQKWSDMSVNFLTTLSFFFNPPLP